MRPGNCFIIFIGISLSWVVYFMSSLLISFKIPSEVTDVRGKTSCRHLPDNIFFNNRDTRMCLLFLIAFSTGQEMLEVLQIYC